MCLIAATSQSDPSDSCFYDSIGSALSKREVVTLVVLGALSLMMATAALYGYLADPSWMAGAHALTGLACATWLTVSALLLIKIIQTQRRTPAQSES